MKRTAVQGRSAAKMAGVTLIELMVVMVIIATLSAIAIPAYRSHITKTSRRAAESCLSEYAQYMERYYTTNLTYVGATPDPECGSDSNLNTRYTFAASGLAQQTYTVKATPIDVQRSQDTLCGTLVLSEDGSRTVTGHGTPEACW